MLQAHVTRDQTALAPDGCNGLSLFVPVPPPSFVIIPTCTCLASLPATGWRPAPAAGSQPGPGHVPTHQRAERQAQRLPGGSWQQRVAGQQRGAGMQRLHLALSSFDPAVVARGGVGRLEAPWLLLHSCCLTLACCTSPPFETLSPRPLIVSPSSPFHLTPPPQTHALPLSPSAWCCCPTTSPQAWSACATTAYPRLPPASRSPSRRCWPRGRCRGTWGTCRTSVSWSHAVATDR